MHFLEISIQNRFAARQGFSLVELSIVLVILGLLVGGVLSGQALIRASQIKSIMTEDSTYAIAVQSFKDKYLALPGDMTNATSFWPTAGDTLITGTCESLVKSFSYAVASTKTCNGNGDGAIGLASSDPNQSNKVTFLAWGNFEESFMAWNQMGLAGLINGQYVGTMQPYSPSGVQGGHGGDIGVDIPAAKSFPSAGWNLTNLCISDGTLFAGTCGNLLTIGGSTSVHNNFLDWTAYPVISTTDALNIDQKMDDGKPGTGFVRSYPHGVIYVPNCTTTTDPTTSQYTTTLTGDACSLIFMHNF